MLRQQKHFFSSKFRTEHSVKGKWFIVRSRFRTWCI